MSPEKHDQIRKILHPDAAQALTRTAIAHGLAIDVFVDGVLGHPLFGRIKPEHLARAKDALGEHAAELEKLRPAWKPTPAPPVLVMVVGCTMTDPEATKAVVDRYFPHDDDYPVRVELSRPGAYVMARHAGTTTDMRDTAPPAGFRAEVEAGLVWPKPAARSIGVDELAQALHEAARESVERGLVVNRIPGQGFIEWGDLTEEAREGRRVMARALLARYDVFERPAAS